MHTLEQRTNGRAFAWRFRSIPELRKALEEYTAMIELMLASKMGKPQGEDGAVEQKETDVTYRIMAQNHEIDRKLAVLCLEAPVYARLLHWYYRTGNSCEAEGWRVAAKRAGFPTRKRMYRGQDMTNRQFEVVLDLALRELFHAH
jgi:hypothetical protein